jgi:hypothetical protein
MAFFAFVISVLALVVSLRPQRQNCRCNPEGGRDSNPNPRVKPRVRDDEAAWRLENKILEGSDELGKAKK